MRVIRDRNVNGLMVSGLEHLAHHGVRQQSRNGPVIVAPWPVTSVYERPTERVLFDERRDANPFFHLFECLWMLSGSNGARALDRYVADFSARYSDDGVIHGAYGHRWRHALGFDQLDAVVRRLRADPDDRQCVLQMWDASQSYEDAQQTYAGGNDLLGDWKDRPCNTHVYLRVQKYRQPKIDADTPQTVEDGQLVLDLTVCCRSNDIVWGAYGANAVHFSFLQEYLAGRVGVGVGVMYQVSNNYHGYVETLDRIGDPSLLPGTDPYEDGLVVPVPIGTNFEAWDDDLRNFMEWHVGGARNQHGLENEFTNTWFRDVAVPMCCANSFRRDGDIDRALVTANKIAASDWQTAAVNWLCRRIKR